MRHDLIEMAFPRSMIERKVEGREQTINEHLVKLAAFDVPEQLRASWRNRPQASGFSGCTSTEGTVQSYFREGLVCVALSRAIRRQ